MKGHININKLKKKMYRAHTIIAKNIRMLRLLNGYTQDQLCEVLHMSRAAYACLERGGKLLDYETLFTLSKFYNIKLEYIISFDISEQMLALICVNREEISAESFITKYLMLSYRSQHHIRKRITDLKAFECSCNIFPWDYEREAI